MRKLNLVTATVICIAFATPSLGETRPAAKNSALNLREHEGDWYVADTTDNNTGERSVYAFQMLFEGIDPGYLTVTLRCSKREPTFFVDWNQLDFPDQAVVTIGAVSSPDSEPAERQYIFEKSEDPVEGGLRASAATSAQIVTAIGRAKYITITVRPKSGPRTVGLEVDGITGAWSRVVRHCPIQTVPIPPL